MKILIYTLNFSPELTGVGKYSAELAEWLAAQGHDVRVVTSLPYYPDWKLHPNYTASYLRPCARTSQPRLTVYRAWLWVPRQPSGLTRVIHLLSYAAASLPLLLREMARRPDMAFVVLPTMTVAPQAALLARLFRVPAWLHVHDFELDAALRLGVLKVRTGTNLLHAIERRLLCAFDWSSTISNGMLDRLVQKGVPLARSSLFPNWVDVRSISPPPGDNSIRREIGLADDDVLVLYAGNMGEKQGLEIVVQVAQLLSEQPRIRFLMVGEGPVRRDLQAQSAALSNVKWWPLQPKARLNLLLHAADVHVLPQRAGAADLVMPSKLGPMLASGRLVIGTADLNTELGAALEAVGVRVSPQDAPALAASITHAANHPEFRAQRGAAGRAFAVETLDKETVLSAFERQCQALINERC